MIPTTFKQFGKGSIAAPGRQFVSAVGTAVVMVMVASLVPARRAARLEPGDVIRGTAL